jgi:pyruvate dehydrogenase E1 component
VVAVSDWIRAVQDQIRDWVPGDFVSLGTDGWGMSDTRGALRRHFLVDAESIAVQTQAMLAKRGEFDRGRLKEAIDRYRLDDPSAADAGNTEGSG